MPEEENSIKRTYTIPKSIIDRHEEYKKNTPTYKQFNASAIVAEALDVKLKEEGF